MVAGQWSQVSVLGVGSDCLGSAPSHHIVMIVPLYDVCRGEQFLLDGRGRRGGHLGFRLEEV